MPEKNTVGSIKKLIDIERIKNGVVYLKDGSLRKVVLVAGTNFDLKSEEEQQLILVAFQNLLNSLDFPTQFNVHSRRLSVKSYLETLEKREQEETNGLLKTQIKDYRNFIASFTAENAIMEKSFLVVVPLESPIISPIGKSSRKDKTETTEENLIERLQKLNQRTDKVINGLRQIGLRAVALEDNELLELYASFYQRSLIVPPASFDDILPERLEINPYYLKIDGRFAKTLFILNYPRYLSSGWLSSIINLPEIMDLAIYINPADTAIALKKLRRKAAEIEVQIAELQEKGEVRNPMLETALRDIEALRDTLQQAQEKLFSVGVYITIYAESLIELNSLESKITSILEGQMIDVKAAIFEQLQGFNSSLPVLKDKMNIKNPLNTSPLSSFFPFTSADLTSDNGILYGINLHNNSLIIFDRFSLENYNMVIFAKSGSGKSYTTKLEVIRSLMMGTDILIIDPENEYEPLAEVFEGSVFRISLNSENHINPFDVPIAAPDEEWGETLKSHIVNLAGLLKLMMGDISPAEEALLDRAIIETYASRDITADNPASKDAAPPLLEDLETVLKNMEGGKIMAERLYRFTKGSYAGFTNQPTNVDVGNRLIIFSIRDLEEELRPIAMYIILNFIWNQVRADPKKRIMIIDEAWWMMKYQDSASFLFGLAKRARKYNLGVTTITQDVEDFLSSPYGRPIITNSSLQLLLKQAPATIDITAKAFGLTEAEKNYLIEADIGQGLFLAGLRHAAIQIFSSPFEHQIITTNPQDFMLAQKTGEEVEPTKEEDRSDLQDNMI